MGERVTGYLRRIEGMTVMELRAEYYRLHERATKSRNKRWLVKRVFYRFQEILEGRRLSDEAREKAEVLAKGMSVRTRGEALPDVPSSRDPRLPEVGSVLRREYDGQVFEVEVLGDGFRWGEEVFGSLSAVAKAITGKRWNGFLFFGLGCRR